MAQKKLWSRMKGWMRPRDAAVPSRDEHTDSQVITEPKPADPVASVPSRGRRNEVALERLQEGYSKVIELVDSIRQHQDRQDERATEISASLSQVAGTLGNIQSASREQTDKLAMIAGELRTINERSGHWEQALMEFPETVKAQRDALGAVVAQLETAGERDGQLAGSLETLRVAVSMLGDATTASSVAVKSLQMAALENQERTVTLMQEQNKRFVMLFVVTLVLALAAIVTGVVGLWS